MNSNTDLTNFWISWHGTCSIRLCLKSQAKEVADLANEVMQSTNADFRNQLRHLGSTSGMRRSIYEDEAAQGGQNGDCGSAFELAESQLYAKATINKRAFKDYLFEEIAGRDGGMNKNLYGYMQRVIYSIARKSFGENVYQPVYNENGTAVDPQSISYDGTNEVRPAMSPAEMAEVKEVIEWFQRFLDEQTSDWDQDDWIVLFCILNLIAVGGAKVRGFFSHGHDTINTKSNRLKGRLLAELRENFEDRAIGYALDGKVQTVLDEKMKKLDCFDALMKILEENRASTGK